MSGRPTLLTPSRLEHIVELLKRGWPFATACKKAGVSPSAAYDWLYRGWGCHPTRPPTPMTVAFAQAVDAIYPQGFAERHTEAPPGTSPPSEQGENRPPAAVFGPATSSYFQLKEASPVARVAQGEKADPREDDPRQAETEVTTTELEATIRIPVAGATMTIPERNREFRDGVAGPRVIDTVHVADVGSLRTVELEDGLLRIELRSGEAYSFPIAELLDGEHDPVLQLRETWAGYERAAYGGSVEKVRLHDVHLARLVGLRLVEPEPEEAPQRWSERTGWSAGP